MRILSQTFEIGEVLQPTARPFVPDKVFVTEKGYFNPVPKGDCFPCVARVGVHAIDSGNTFDSGGFATHPQDVFPGGEKFGVWNPRRPELGEGSSHLVGVRRIDRHPDVDVTCRSRPPVQCECPASGYHVSHAPSVQNFEEVPEVWWKLLLLHTKSPASVGQGGAALPASSVRRRPGRPPLDPPGFRNRSPNFSRRSTTC